eukprot:Gb_17899 [translate_table: standard]
MTIKYPLSRNANINTESKNYRRWRELGSEESAAGDCLMPPTLSVHLQRERGRRKLFTSAILVAVHTVHANFSKVHSSVEPSDSAILVAVLTRIHANFSKVGASVEPNESRFNNLHPHIKFL